MDEEKEEAELIGNKFFLLQVFHCSGVFFCMVQ